MEQSVTRATAVRSSPFARLRAFWAEIQQARAIAAEFAALNALTDADLRRMGLTRSVLKRHLKQKYTTRAMLAPSGGWHDADAPDHDARPR